MMILIIVILRIHKEQCLLISLSGMSNIYPTIKIGYRSQKRKRKKLKLLKDRFSMSCQIV